MAHKKATFQELEARRVAVASAKEAPAESPGDSDRPEAIAGEAPRTALGKFSPGDAGDFLPGDRSIRILVADDHDITRRWLFHLIQHEADMEVVGLAADGETAIATVRLARPDVILLDVEMTGMSGIEATRRILAEFPDAKVIGLSMYDEEYGSPTMKEAGAVAYIEKAGSTEAVLKAIRGAAMTLGAPGGDS